MSKGKIMWKWLRFSHKSHYEVINVEKVCVSILAKTFCNRPFSSKQTFILFQNQSKNVLIAFNAITISIVSSFRDFVLQAHDLYSG